MLVTFVLFGHWMEMRSRRRSSDALNALLRLVPSQANMIGRDGEIQMVPVGHVQADDLLLLRPGEKVPVDGVVTEGESYTHCRGCWHGYWSQKWYWKRSLKRW
jgi:P-type Cu2+ transporter